MYREILWLQVTFYSIQWKKGGMYKIGDAENDPENVSGSPSSPTISMLTYS